VPGCENERYPNNPGDTSSHRFGVASTPGTQRCYFNGIASAARTDDPPSRTSARQAWMLRIALNGRTGSEPASSLQTRISLIHTH
jgi:hypothetical protein